MPSKLAIFLIIFILAILLAVITFDNNKISMETIIFDTNYGVITIELYKDLAPITTANFEKLVSDGFYDKILFHRVIDGFVIQGGDPLTKDESKRNLWGTGGPGYKFEDEIHGQNINEKYSLSMANSGPNTNGSQFFINLAYNQHLDDKHTVFGSVIKGMDVIDKIADVKVGPGDIPKENVIITKAYING